MNNRFFREKFGRKPALVKPGWLMSEEQARWFWRNWPLAVAEQGWTAAESEDRRRAMLADLGFKSLKDVDKKDGFDRLKQRVMELQDRLVAEKDDAGQRRRFLHRIGEQRVELEELMGGEEASAYLDPIFRDRFHLVPGAKALEDLSTGELEKMVMTLDRVVKDQREVAQDEHDEAKAMEIEEESPF